MKKKERTVGLCFRCDHRAEWFEKGSRPRYECGEADKSVVACYMYSPVRPVISKRLYPAKEDPRPEYGGLIGCRMKAEKVAERDEDIKLSCIWKDDGSSFLLWVEV